MPVACFTAGQSPSTKAYSGLLAGLSGECVIATCSVGITSSLSVGCNYYMILGFPSYSILSGLISLLLSLVIGCPKAISTLSAESTPVRVSISDTAELVYGAPLTLSWEFLAPSQVGVCFNASSHQRCSAEACSSDNILPC